MFELIAYSVGPDMHENRTSVGSFRTRIECEARATTYKKDISSRISGAVYAPWRFRTECIERDVPKLQKTDSSSRQRTVYKLRMYAVSDSDNHAIEIASKTFETKDACYNHSKQIIAIVERDPRVTPYFSQMCAPTTTNTPTPPDKSDRAPFIGKTPHRGGQT